MGQTPYVLLGMLVALLAAVPAFADPSIRSKQAEAQQVLGQMNALDANLERAVEQYDAATVRLGLIKKAQRQNAFELTIAKRNLGKSRTAIARRLVSLYTADDNNSTLEVILGSKSLDDVVTSIDNADRVASLDNRVLHEVETFKGAVKRHQQALAQAKALQVQVVQERAAQRSDIEGKLAERRRLLSSIQSEIAQLQAQERARQARIEAQVRARLAAQQRAAAAQAQAPAQAAQAQATPAAPAEQVSAPEAAAAPASAPQEAPAPAAAPPSRYGGVVGIAMQYLGTPYRWGGGDPSGFDCSGFTAYVYGKLGVSLPHYTGAQWGMGVAVSRGDLQAGDLVFFDGLNHVGLYIGGGQFIHAPHTGDVVKISSLGDSWYASTYMGARRIV
jgi:cell wall-associated NlpC family hydrolase